MNRGKRALRLSALVTCMVLGAAACGSSPSAEQTDTDALNKFKNETANRLDEINSQLEGLNAKERRDKLLELAEEEGGSFNVYGSTNLDEMGPLIEVFEDSYDITVNYYRANSEDVLQRAVEEAKAGFQGADVIQTNGPEMTILDRQGLFSPLDTPVTADITPEGVEKNWAWMYINTFTPAWNTDEISPAEAPKSWEDVLTKYKGQLAMEAADIDWFATLVKDYFMEQKGMSEQEAVGLFKEAASQATVVDGHTLMTELLAGGQFGVAASPYLHRVQQLQGDGAPIDWEPAIEPLIARPNGVAIHAAAEHPASAMLFTEWALTDAQSELLQFDRQPASTAVENGGLPTQYENIVVDVDAVVDELDKWTDLYDEVVRQSPKDVLED